MSLSLLSLPAELWGLIYDHLDSKEDRRNFTHVCKDIHDAKEIRERITKLVLRIPKKLDDSLAANSPKAWADAQLQSFTWPRLICLEFRGLESERHYEDEWMPFLIAALRAATTAHGFRHLIISDRSSRLDYFPSACLGDICAAAPQLENLELNVILDDEGDFSPVQSLQHLKHLGIQRTRWNDVATIKGLCNVLRSCTRLESLVLPHAQLCGLTDFTSVDEHYTSSPLRTPPVRCPSVKRLRMSGVVADTLPDVKWLLDMVFPSVRQLDVRCIQLVSYDAALQEDREAAMLERIRQGAADVLASGRAWLVDDVTGELLLLGIDDFYFSNEHLSKAEYRPLYERALGALLLGWLGGEERQASAVRSIFLANMFVAFDGVLAMCARHFRGVRMLVLDNSVVTPEDDCLFLSKCIGSFPLLSRVTVMPFKGGMDAAVLCTAVLLACHQVHLQGASAGDMVFCLHDNFSVSDLSTEVDQALALYRVALGNYSEEGPVRMRVALEVSDYSDYKHFVSEIEGGQFYSW